MHSRIYCDSADRALLPSDISKAFVVSAYGLTERSDYKTKIVKTKIIYKLYTSGVLGSTSIL